MPALARWPLGLGIAATLATNVAHGLVHGPIGAAVAAWPAVALVGSYELLLMIIRGTQPAADISPKTQEPWAGVPDTLQALGAWEFAVELIAGCLPSIPVTPPLRYEGLVVIIGGRGTFVDPEGR